MYDGVVDIIPVFMVLFAVIDILGSLPLIIELKRSSGNVNPMLTTLVAVVILFVFLFTGEMLLGLFGVDISSFAVAGAIILFFIGLEMVLDFRFSKHETHTRAAIIPLAFPLIAGPGSITTLISLRAEYSLLTISIALAINLCIVYFVLRLSEKIGKYIGNSGLYIIKKFFGIILLAMAVKLFASNLNALIG